MSIAQNNSKCRAWVVRLVSREYANLSGSKKGHSLDSLNPPKGKYNNLDKRESGITEKSHEISLLTPVRIVNTSRRTGAVRIATANYLSINRGTSKDKENFLKLWADLTVEPYLAVFLKADFMAYLILSKNNPWVIFNKITSSSMTLSEGNRHSFRICLANERYFHITGLI